MENCIFCKITDGTVPTPFLYEDEHTVAFLDMNQNITGHTLVVPKKHTVNIFDTDDETLARSMATVRRVASAVRDSVGAHGVNIDSNHGATAGQVVFHLHFHIIPRHDRSEFSFPVPTDNPPGNTDILIQKIRRALA